MTSRSSVLVTSLIASALIAVAFLPNAWADPKPPNPPSQELLPVFCFRITDIQPIEEGASDPGPTNVNRDGTAANDTNDYRFTFEFLNWTDTPASGMYFAVNTGAGAAGAKPSISDAGVKADGSDRTSADPTDILPSTTNDWIPDLLPSFTGIKWTGPILPLTNHDLLGEPILKDDGTGTPQNVPAPINPADSTTYDDSTNALDGFTLDLDDFITNSAISINWWLLDASGDPIGTSSSGNEAAFGTINLARVTPPNTLSAPLEGNTGYMADGGLFYDSSEIPANSLAGEGINIDPLPIPLPGGPFEQDVFLAELGSGITAPFADPSDALLATDTGVVDLGPTVNAAVFPSVVVPEPSGLSLALLGLLAVLRRR